MKKLLSFFAALCIIVFGTTFASAKQIVDVTPDHWAAREILYVVNAGIMGVTKDGAFNPAENITRADFNSILLRTLGHKATASSMPNIFTDVDENFWAYSDIMKSQSLGLIYGYGDNTFRPLKNITKSEAASVISHITQDQVIDEAVLNGFVDRNNIPAWAVPRFAKSVQMGVYVNYPNANELLPNKLLDRAECAVLMAKLRASMEQVKKEFVAEETVLGIEHLDVSPDASTNEVKITNFRKIILPGNVLLVNFAEDFYSKRHVDGSDVKFVNTEDIVTREGTLLIPAGSCFTGRVSALQPQRVFNRNAAVDFEITNVTLPNGDSIDFNAVTVKTLRPSKLANAGKVAAYTLGGAVAGGGLGGGLAAAGNGDNKYGVGIGVGAGSGAGVGLFTGLITPGLQYKGHVGDPVYIKLLTDLVIKN
ncbi:MAG: S-layer homology domain-containing protein [Candidatus Gastranaerophilaceae bacterium]